MQRLRKQSEQYHIQREKGSQPSLFRELQGAELQAEGGHVSCLPSTLYLSQITLFIPPRCTVGPCARCCTSVHFVSSSFGELNSTPKSTGLFVSSEQSSGLSLFHVAGSMWPFSYFLLWDSEGKSRLHLLYISTELMGLWGISCAFLPG